MSKKKKGDFMKRRSKRVLMWLMILVFVVGFVAVGFAEEAKKYPPYPDVWGVELPWPRENDRYSMIDIAKISDGDYLIKYYKTKKEIKIKTEHGLLPALIGRQGISFFTGKIYSQQEISISDKNAKLSGIERQKQIIFKDGSKIELKHDPVGNFYTTGYIAKEDSNGKILSEKILLYLYDKPIKTKIDETRERNWDYKKAYYFKKVENISAFFIPLEDDTFLLYDYGGNIIIRFDKDFKTKSSLINNKVFMLDKKKTDDILWKTGIDDQALNNDMAVYLMKQKKEASNGTNSK